MFQRKKMSGKHADEGGMHGDRPWVYFMIDSFFLVTQFFVLTFQIRTGEDLVLPHKLPPGTPEIRTVSNPLIVNTKPVLIAVNRDESDAPARYRINGGSLVDFRDINAALNSMAVSGGNSTYSVRISYEGKVVFSDVMPIFNTCVSLKIKECGLQPSRQARATF